MKRTNTAKWIEEKKTWRIDVQKNKVRRSFYSSTPGRAGQREANAKADEWLEIDKGEEDRLRLTVIDAYAEWKESIKMRTSTANWKPAINRMDKWLIPQIGHIKVSALTEQHLQNVIDHAYKKGGLSAKSLRNIRGDISSFMKFCRKSSYTELRPEDLEIPRGAEKKKKRILTPAEVAIVFSSSRTVWMRREMQDRYIYAYRLLISEGLRPGELLAIKRSSIRGDEIEIEESYNSLQEVTKGKNENARRKIKLSRYGMEAVEGQLAMLKKEGIISPLLFPAEDGGYVNHNCLRNNWYRYCEHNGIKRVTLYELRHTFVSILKDMPEGLKKITVGHSANMDTEGIYAHEIEGDRELAATFVTSAFDRILDKPKAK